jgi:hypothetical protein
MTNYQIRKSNEYTAEVVFISDNAADFPKDSKGDKAVKGLADCLAQIQTFSGEQVSNLSRQSITVKGDRLQKLIEILQMMNRAANAMADDIDGIEDLFRMPRRRSESVWLAVARTFHADSAPYNNEFKEYDLPDGFRETILTLVNEIETASSSADSATSQRAGATGGLIDVFRNAGRFSRQLNAVVLNKYRDNAQKLAVWAVASHLEAAAKSKVPPTPPTP